jgi:class 3 adenylate cyclase
MCEAVFQEEGTLDKFIGDAVLAVFGAPLPQADHAERALRAAAAMRRAVAALDSQPPIVLRIALNSGLATVGDIGSPKRREYTALGDVVNTCSRLVSYACAPGQIILSAATRDRLNGSVSLRPLGPATIRGRQGSVDLFELSDDGL